MIVGRVCHIYIMNYEKEDKRGRCLECGDVLPYGSRTDMKFCSVSCKSRWHYTNGSRLKGLRLKTIGALDRNHEILETLLSKGISSMDIQDLVQMGFNINCVTSYHKVRRHDEYRCFDIKYIQTPSRITGIEKVKSISSL